MPRFEVDIASAEEETGPDTERAGDGSRVSNADEVEACALGLVAPNLDVRMGTAQCEHTRLVDLATVCSWVTPLALGSPLEYCSARAWLTLGTCPFQVECGAVVDRWMAARGFELPWWPARSS